MIFLPSKRKNFLTLLKIKTMNEFIEAIEAKVALLKEEGEKFFVKGNKAAGSRTRGIAMDIIKDCKGLRNQVTETKKA